MIGSTERRGTTTAGFLALVALAAGVLSVVPVLEEADYLGAIAEREGEVVSGALFQTLMVPAYAGFALALYPTLRRAGTSLALGFVAFRLTACGFHLLAVAMLPLFLDLARGFDGSTAADAATYDVVAETLRSGRDLVNHVAVIVATAIGDILLFSILYRWRLVPRWLSAWGLAGAVLAIVASLMVLSRMVEVVGVPYLSLNAPLAIHSVVLAGWLIGRGFDRRHLPSR